MRDRKRACLLGQSGELFFPFDLANRSVTKNSLFRSELKKKFGIPRLPFFLPPTMDSELGSIAAQLVSDGGILASDESPPTLGKRLVKAGLENDEVIESFEFLLFSSSFSFSLPSSQPQPRPLQLLLKKLSLVVNPLRLALLPLRRQARRERHPRLHRLRGGADSASARNLPGRKGGSRKG